MTLESPNLDDRTFADLRREALAVIAERCPQWTDLSASDPGVTLMEVFAYLTEVLIYRVNRIPEKAHVALLNVLGVAPLAPAPAEAILTFGRPAGSGREFPALTIPAGTQVADATGTVTFETVADAVLPARAAGQQGDGPTVDVLALNAERVVGEIVGRGTGKPGQSVGLRRGPALRRPNDGGSLVVAVELPAGDDAGELEKRSFDGKPFAIWREVAAFAGHGPADRVYVADRATGQIAFGPADVGPDGARGMGAAPPAGAEIRASYLRGGGRQGNVAPGALSVLRTPLRDVVVENRARASGGEDMEPLDRALLRGRQAVRVLRSAVTARDFEVVACETPGIARARAYAQRDVWSFGRAGVVDVLVVPAIGLDDRPDGITASVLAEHQTAQLLANAGEMLRRRRPVGVETRVDWARCRPVDISARVVVSSVEDKGTIAARLTRRIHALLAPDGGWSFGRPLRASDLYEAFLAEPGVRYAERLAFHIADAPSADIEDIHRDACQPTTLFVAGRALFRSLDGGESWAPVLRRPDETMLGVRTSPALPGHVAAFARRVVEGKELHVVYVSEDGGESWMDRRGPSGQLFERVFEFAVRDIAWREQDGTPLLLVAGRSALLQIRFGDPVTVEAVPVRGASEAEQNEDQKGFVSVATASHVSGLRFVAVAARENGGVFVSSGGPFRLLPDTAGRTIRVLAFQKRGNETFLWAGLVADMGEPGKGAMRIGMRVDGSHDPTGWESFDANWQSGSCEALDFWDDLVAAGANRGGIVTWRLGVDKAWSDPAPVSSGLPLVDERRTIAPAGGAAIAPGAGGPVLFFGSQGGAFASADLGRTYRPAGPTDFEDRVPLPRNWLFCSGAVALEVVAESSGEA